jgi:hypothetical protein
MGDTSGFDWKRLGRWQLGVFLLSVLGIIIFVLLWQGLGDLGFDQFPRLIVSLCAPPAIIAVLIGGYILIFRMRG